MVQRSTTRKQHKVREQILFFNSFMKGPGKVGAITPSGRRLCTALVDSFDWNEVRYVAEFGPGTGVVTELIVDRLHPDAKFFAVERDPKLARTTRERCPSADVIEGSVVDIEKFCQQRNFPHLDAIVSGLPWASFNSQLQKEIFEAMFRVLRPGGRFATFAYLQGVGLPAGQRFSKLLKQSFSTVAKSRVVWRNLPPAFVYRCTR